MNDGVAGDESKDLEGPDQGRPRRSAEDFGFCSERHRKPREGVTSITLAAAAWGQQQKKGK